MKHLPRGLYAVTDGSDDGPLLARVEALLSGGAVLLQYRAKSLPVARRRDQAQALLALCREARVPLVINDDLELASAIGADGIHLGRDDAAPSLARERLGADAIIGVSCYADLARARTAVAAGADYVAFGSVHPSPTKPDAVRAPLELIAAARRTLGCPICAIGGITLANAPGIIAAGADLLAVITDLAEAADPRARAEAYRALFVSSAT
ncbi:MAG: thiamine phosphate synthase [Gammaproteobacteria bacterium]|nr:thiamine phosphate synthase [Gammaproteobacteria bacterium]